MKTCSISQLRIKASRLVAILLLSVAFSFNFFFAQKPQELTELSAISPLARLPLFGHTIMRGTYGVALVHTTVVDGMIGVLSITSTRSKLTLQTKYGCSQGSKYVKALSLHTIRQLMAVAPAS